MLYSENLSKYSSGSKLKKGEGQYTQDNRLVNRLEINQDYNSNSGFENGKVYEYDEGNQDMSDVSG